MRSVYNIDERLHNRLKVILKKICVASCTVRGSSISISYSLDYSVLSRVGQTLTLVYGEVLIISINM